MTTSARGSRSSPIVYLWVVALLLSLLLALAALPTLLLIAVTLLLVVLPLIDPVFGLYLAVVSVPVQELIQLPGGVSATQAAVIWALAAWALRVLAHPERRISAGRLLWCWAALFFALLLSSSLTPFSQSTAIKETARWCVAFAVWLLAVNNLKQPWQVAGLLACLVLVPTAEAILGLAQFFTGAGPASFRIAADQPFVRAYGTFGTPNTFAGYMNMAWPLALALALGATRQAVRPPVDQPGADRQPAALLSRRTAWWTLAIMTWLMTWLLLAALLASFSRGAWLGAAAGLISMPLAVGRRTLQLLAVGAVAAALVIALGAAGLLPTAVVSRFASITAILVISDPSQIEVTPANFAQVERMAQMQAGARMLAAHPLTGVGPGNYTLAYPQVTVAPWYVSRGHAHNYYLHMAAEAGLVGLLAYLVLVGGASYQALIMVRRADRTFWRSIGIGCCGIIAAVAGHNLFENLHVLNMGIQLAAVWAFGSIWERMALPQAPILSRGSDICAI